MKLKDLLFISAAHLVNDGYSGMLSPLLPLIAAKFDLTLTTTGMLVSGYSLFAAMSQPVLGYFADKSKRTFFVVTGPLMSCIFMSLLGVAPNIIFLLLFLAMAGLGVSSFHPQAASLAGKYSGDQRGWGLGIFIMGGTIGYGAGPLAISYYVSAYSFDTAYLMMLPGLATIALYLAIGPGIPSLNINSHRQSIRKIFRFDNIGMIFLVATAYIRGLTIMAFNSFIPFLILERGGEIIASGTAIFMLQFFGAIGGVAGGWLSDRFGRMGLILLSLGLAPIFFIGSLYLPGLWIFPLLAAGGFLMLSSNPVSVAFAQELLPGNQGLAASLIVGLSWGLAGLTISLVGLSADSFGILETLTVVSLLPFTVMIMGIITRPYILRQAHRVASENGS